MLIINQIITFLLINLMINQFVDEVYADECTFEHNKLIGTCVLASKCPHVYIDFRKGIRPTICSFERNEPIVCCSSGHQSEKLVEGVRKSSEYCNLYGTPEQLRFSRATIVGGKMARGGEFPHMITHTRLKTKTRKIRSESNLPPNFPVLGIVGGVQPQIDEFPHMAAIGWRKEDNEIEWNCGGSLISLNFVLTAAHCTNYRGNSPSVIRIGETDLRSGEATSVYPNEFRIASIISHPDYKLNHYYDDIALMKLDKGVAISDKVRPACLWQSDSINFTYSTVIGYGLTEYGGKPSSHLLKADLQVFDNSECFNDYPKSRKLEKGVISTQLCAGDPTGERDTCQGDSGGPLQTFFITNNQKTYHIVGITSFGKACATTLPAIYTRVSSYLDWIEGIVWP